MNDTSVSKRCVLCAQNLCILCPKFSYFWVNLRSASFLKMPPTHSHMKVSGHLTYRFRLVIHALSRSGGTGVFTQSHENLLEIKVKKYSKNRSFSLFSPKSNIETLFFRRVATELHRSHRILISTDSIDNARTIGPDKIAHRRVLGKSVDFRHSA